MKRQYRMSILERALIEKQWHSTALDAQIHALYGDSSDGMVNASGRIFFVVLGAAMAQGINHDQPEMRIIRGAVNAMYEQKGVPVIQEQRRQSIRSGLEAAERLIASMERRNLVDSACELTMRLRSQHVNFSEFQALMIPVKEEQC